MELQERIKKVAALRQSISEMKEAKEVMLKQWEAEHIDFLTYLKEKTEELINTELLLRVATVQAYEETGNKTPALGVGIRELTKYDYDSGKALQWAKSHDMALKLDDTAFKKIIKADTPDFVTVTKEVTATIATDLSEYLKEEE